jgi:transformation/transcription domain-associated protein
VKALKLIIHPMLNATFRARAAHLASLSTTTNESRENEEKAPLTTFMSLKAKDSNAHLVGTYPEVLDPEVLDAIIKLLGSDVQHYDEEMRIEFLRLVTLLIKYVHSSLTGYRRELIKFAWNHLKTDNSPSKMWAYVTVCRFIDAYDTPAKIVLQVYVALLRTFQPEHRLLVRKALDILMPALPRRLPPGEHKYPTWIKWTKKLIVEEGHLVPQLIHVWNLIVRHPQFFYASRAQFIPQM